MFKTYNREHLTNRFKNPKEEGILLTIYAKECNKKCKYCLWGDDNSHSKLDLDKALIESVLAKNKDVNLIYSGGEPFFDKETLAYVKYLVDKYSFKSVTILSNMDFYEPFDVNFFPVCIISHNNYKKMFPSRLDGSFVWNTIWIDDIREDKIIFSKEYNYLFRMKFKTLYNNDYIPNEVINRSLIESILEKLKYSGSGINFVWPHSHSSMMKLVKDLDNPYMSYQNHIFQPSGIDRNSNRVHACKTCPYETCNAGIEVDDCAMMNKICYSCKYISICPMTAMYTESVDVSFYKDCSTLKWLLSLKEKYVGC